MKNLDVAEILSIDANNLKQKQFEALKQHGIDVLTEIIDLLKKDKFDDIRQRTFYSPAGDGVGSNNNCIEFNWCNDKDSVDIDSYLDTLESLKKK